MKITFGKYKDYDIQDVPDEYLEWFVRSNKKLLEAIENEIAAREAAKLGSLSLAEKIIEAGYKSLAQKMHPDRGGSNGEMSELNATRQAMRNRL